MGIKKFFSNMLKSEAANAEAQRRKMIARLPRVSLEPLHKISFSFAKEETLLSIVNISGSGMGLTRNSRAQWPLASELVDGALDIDGQRFVARVKIVHISPAVVGISFEKPERAMIIKIYQYLAAELAALEMTLVPRESLKEEPDGNPYWFQGKGNCEFFFVESDAKILRFHLAYFGHYLEGGENRNLRYGVIVDEPVLGSPTYKGASLVRWESRPNAEILATAVRLIQNIRQLQPELKQKILNQIA